MGRSSWLTIPTSTRPRSRPCRTSTLRPEKAPGVRAMVRASASCEGRDKKVSTGRGTRVSWGSGSVATRRHARRRAPLRGSEVAYAASRWRRGQVRARSRFRAQPEGAQLAASGNFVHLPFVLPLDASTTSSVPHARRMVTAKSRSASRSARMRSLSSLFLSGTRRSWRVSYVSLSRIER